MPVAKSLTRQQSVFHAHRLENGLQMIGQSIPGVQSTASIFWVLTGTRDESPETIGVSHFLEHMAFRRTQHRTGQEVDRAFEEMGAENNAATSKEMTFYWARVLAQEAPNAIELLAELTHPALTEEDFEQERPVILEEIARYEDQPSHVLTDLFFHDYFGNHPLAWEVLGTKDTISSLTIDQMRQYWIHRYGATNVLFSIAGVFDWDAVVRQVGSLTANWNVGNGNRQLFPPAFSPRMRVHRRDKFFGEQVAIGVPSVSARDERYWAAALLASILGDDTGSRLYWALYQEGLAEFATANLLSYEDCGSLLVHISAQPDTARTALEVARKELQRIQDFDVEQEELDRAKAKLTSSVIIGGESTNERVFGLINSWLTRGQLETLEETREKIDAVRLEDMRVLVEELPVAPVQATSAVGPMAAEDLET
jgi:predicted Zn-dependent peptidase